MSTSRTPRILIVEDEKTASRALQRKFENSGFQPTIVENGEDAMRTLATEKFDVMLLDLILPKVDGYEVLKQLQAAKNNIPVIVLTNLGAEHDAEKSKQLGAKEHFIKSMTPMKQVVQCIEQLLDLPRTSDA